MVEVTPEAYDQYYGAGAWEFDQVYGSGAFAQQQQQQQY